MVEKAQWQMVPIGDELSDLFPPRRKLCLLVGSGISIDPPSSLPTGFHFMQELIGRVVPEPVHGDVLALVDHGREGMRGPGDFLRFEDLMEFLSRSIDTDLRVLDGYAASTTCNLNHLFLAQMIKRGHAVLTTNFDSLIEHALMESEVPRDRIRPIIHQEDWEAQGDAQEYRVYKLHGSLIDVRDGCDCRRSIQATIGQIAAGKQEMLQLEPWKRNVIRSLLQDGDLVIAGYSGLDDFDVLPTLWSISSEKNVLWVNHVHKTTVANARIQRLEEYPASKGRDSSVRQEDRLDRILSGFPRARSRQARRVVRIDVDTRELLLWLWRRWISESLPSLKGKTEAVGLEIPALSISDADRWVLAAQIFHDHEFLASCREAYEAGLKCAKVEQRGDVECECLNGIGHVLEKQGSRGEALESYEEALQVADRSRDLRGKAIILNGIATLHLNEGRTTEALQVQHEALAAAERLQDPRWKARTLNNIGLTQTSLASFGEAREAYDEAMAINDQLGDLRAKSTNLLNLAILLEAEGRVDEALARREEVLALADLTGDLQKKAMALAAIGLLLKSQGKREDALDYYRRSLRVCDEAEVPGVQVGTLLNLALLLYQEGRRAESLECCDEALGILEEYEDPGLEGRTLDLRGNILRREGRSAEAIESVRRSMTIFQKIGDERNECDSLTSLALAYHDAGRRAQALKTVSRARALAEFLEDPYLLRQAAQVRALIERGL